MAIELVEPVKRVEHYLYALCVMDFSNIPIPRSRLEFFAHGLITGVLPEFQAETREEVYITAIITGDYANLPLPKSRADQLLYKICLGETEIRDIELETRYEMLLAYIAEHGYMPLETVLVECVNALQTIPNTIETSIASGTVKGDTLVNVLGEPCYKDSMANKASQKLVTNFDANNATFVDETLKGQTLVNLAIEKDVEFTGANQWKHLRLNQSLLNSSKKYLLSFDSSQDYNGYVNLRNIIDNAYITGAFMTSFKQGNNKFLIKDFLQTELNTFADIRVTFYLNNDSVVIPTISNIIFLEYQDGMENWDIPYFEGTRTFGIPHPVDGEIKSAILTGNTLVNLHPLNASITGSGKVFFSTVDVPSSMIEPNTKYFLHLYNTHSSIFSAYFRPCDTTTIAFEDINNKYVIFTTKSTFTDSDFNNNKIHFYSNTDITKDDVKNTKIVLCKYVEGMENWDIPYFDGMQSVKLPVLCTTGKNVCDMVSLANELNKIDNKIVVLDKSTWEITSTSAYAKDSFKYRPIKFKENTSYTISFEGQTTDDTRTSLANIFQINYTDETTSTMRKLGVNNLITSANKTIDSIALTYGVMGTKETISNFSIVEGESSTYEPYKSNILSTSEEVVLRGIGDVRDELNLLTGEVTERIGEVVLNGSEGWYIYTLGAQDNVISFMMNDLDNKRYGVIACDKLRVVNTLSEGNALNAECIVPGTASAGLTIYISKDKVSDVETLKQYLSQNPIAVQYPLATESIKTVDLTILDQDNQPQTALHSFTDGRINVQSQGLLPSVDYVVPTDNSYYHIAKPNTLYSVKNGLVDTFTTPSDLKPMLILEGSQAMMIGGTSNKELPYFTGMQSVQMLGLTTTGKNLFDVHKVVEESSNKVSVTKNNETITITSISERGACYRDLENIPVYLKANVRYAFSSNYTIKGDGQPFMRFYEVQDGGVRKTINATHKDDGSKIIKECTPTKDTIAYISLYASTGADGRVGSSVSYYNIQLEESETTSYEPHKSNILTVNEGIELRGIGDVKDELNLMTGELTQRIGEIVFDGSDDERWSINNSSSDSTLGLTGFILSGDIPNRKTGIPVLCDSLPIITKTGSVGVFNGVNLNIILDDCTTVDELRTKLVNNPITVQYRFATESIKTVDLSIVDQDGNAMPCLSTFNGATHVSINAVDIIPQVDLEVHVDANTMANVASQQDDLAVAQASLSDAIDAQNDDIEMTQNALDEVKGE